MARSSGFDIKKMFDDVADYFTHMSIDIQIAWAILGLGMILVIIGVVML